MSDEPAEPELLISRKGSAGCVTLNRPKALNALTLGMVRGLDAALRDWIDDPGIDRIIVTGSGDKAFCAGGDIRLLHDLGKAGRQAEALNFWREEYLLNILIQSCPKPYIALIDGIVMGGGVGVSLHGRYRIAGDRTVFAMPEVGIGFFPDVGATYALPRLPGAAGTWLAVTGDRIRAADCVALGLATHYVPSARHAELAQALTGPEPVEAVLARFASDAGAAPVEDQRALIDRCFAPGSVPEIIAALSAAADGGEPTAARHLATLATKSPTSMAIAARQMQLGCDLSFTEAMALEFRIVSRVMMGHDFYEGVRAVIIDKDNAPRWRPASVAEVTPAMIDTYVASLGPDELKV